jgi:hypothetical protein
MSSPKRPPVPQKAPPKPASASVSAAHERLAAALRENLAKRKSQQRARSKGVRDKGEAG